MNQETREFWELVLSRIREHPETIHEALVSVEISVSIGRWCYDQALAGEWIGALNGGTEGISLVLLGDGYRFDELRHCCPAVFRGLVSDIERWEIHARNH